MKKYLLGLTLALMLLVSPAAADAPFKLVVNDKPIDKPIVMIDNTAYVPIRAVAETFKADVDWNYQTKTISIKGKAIDPKAIKRPAIKGDAEFKEKINDALDLLEEKDFPHYWMVCMNTEDIAWLQTPPYDEFKNAIAFHVGGSIRILPLLTDNPKQYTPVFLAGVLAHEACHAVNNNYRKPITEKEAYAQEYAVYVSLDAPQWMKDHCLNR